MTLTLTVHRGTRQIGGSCIEIAHPDGDRLILDAGRPLDAPEGATGLLPTSLDRTQPASAEKRLHRRAEAAGRGRLSGAERRSTTSSRLFHIFRRRSIGIV